MSREVDNILNEYAPTPAPRPVVRGAPVKKSDDIDSILNEYSPPAPPVAPLAPSPSMSKNLEAGITSAGSQLTMGYLPQLTAAVGKMMPSPDGDIADLEKQGFTVSRPEETYTSLRDAEVKREGLLADEAPVASIAGTVAGLVPSTILGGAAMKGAGLLKAPAATALGRLGQATATGAAQSAVYNPGDVEGEISPLQLKERGENAAKGGLISGALQGAGEAIPKIGKSLEKTAIGRSFRTMGAKMSDVKRLFKQDPVGMTGRKAEEVGEYAIKNKLFAPGDSMEQVADKVGAKKAEVGQAIGSTYETVKKSIDEFGQMAKDSLKPNQKQAIEATNINAKKLVKEISDQVREEFKGKAASSDAVKEVEKRLGELINLKKENLSLDDIIKFRKSVDDIIPWDQGLDASGKAGVMALKSLRGKLVDKVDDVVGKLDDAFGTENTKLLKSLNKEYGHVSELDRVARTGLASQRGNNFMGLTDTILGGAVGAASGGDKFLQGDFEGGAKGLLTGLGVGLASKGLRTYGSPVMTRGMYSTGKMLQNIPAPNPATSGLLGGRINANQKREK